jgi:type I restriction enzyme R subunit
MEKWMQEQNLVNEPQEVYNIKGDAARVEFIKNF